MLTYHPWYSWHSCRYTASIFLGICWMWCCVFYLHHKQYKEKYKQLPPSFPPGLESKNEVRSGKRRRPEEIAISCTRLSKIRAARAIGQYLREERQCMDWRGCAQGQPADGTHGSTSMISCRRAWANSRPRRANSRRSAINCPTHVTKVQDCALFLWERSRERHVGQD